MKITRLRDIGRRPIILQFMPNKSTVPKKLPWYYKGFGYIGMGIAMLFGLTIIFLFLAVIVWAGKYLWGAF